MRLFAAAVEAFDYQQLRTLLAKVEDPFACPS
jgi:hypothetical protein